MAVSKEQKFWSIAKPPKKTINGPKAPGSPLASEKPKKVTKKSRSTEK